MGVVIEMCVKCPGGRPRMKGTDVHVLGLCRSGNLCLAWFALDIDNGPWPPGVGVSTSSTKYCTAQHSTA